MPSGRILPLVLGMSILDDGLNWNVLSFICFTTLFAHPRDTLSSVSPSKPGVRLPGFDLCLS
jgi:hypothetical protein